MPPGPPTLPLTLDQQEQSWLYMLLQNVAPHYQNSKTARLIAKVQQMPFAERD